MDIARALQIARPNSEWSLNSNDYEQLSWFGPGEKPTIEELAAAWTHFEEIKVWMNAQEFMQVFSMEEKAAVALSTDPTLAALRLELSTWLSTVHADDARVVAGLNKLVELGIISAERKTEILATAS